MDVTLAVLADAANVSKEGKLNVLGIFDTIYAQSFPAIHPIMQLVMRFECGAAEFGTEKELKIVLLDADGHKLSSVEGTLTISQEQRTPHIKIDHCLSFKNVRFNVPGDYALSILVSGEEKSSVPIHLVQKERRQDEQTNNPNG